jgi:hypothetical protein
MVNLTPQSLYPLKRTAVSTEQEDGWAPEAAWTSWRRDIYHAPSGIATPDGLARISVCRYLGSHIGCYLGNAAYLTLPVTKT